MSKRLRIEELRSHCTGFNIRTSYYKDGKRHVIPRAELETALQAAKASQLVQVAPNAEKIQEALPRVRRRSKTPALVAHAASEAAATGLTVAPQVVLCAAREAVPRSSQEGAAPKVLPQVAEAVAAEVPWPDWIHVPDCAEFPSMHVERLRGQYNLLTSLGRGSFGVVYKCIHTTSEKLVAIKLMKNTSSTVAEAFQEILALSACSDPHHPHVVRCVDAFMLIGCTAIVMELADMSVFAWLRQATETGRNTASEEPRFALHVTAGLGHLHARSIVHSDLHCSNILMKATGSAFNFIVGDLGCSAPTGSYRRGPVAHMCYRAPELFYAAGHVWRGPNLEQWAKTRLHYSLDMWALGMLLQDIACGRPFSLLPNISQASLLTDEQAAKALKDMLGFPPVQLVTKYAWYIPKCIKDHKVVSPRGFCTSLLDDHIVKRLCCWDWADRPRCGRVLELLRECVHCDEKVHDVSGSLCFALPPLCIQFCMLPAPSQGLSPHCAIRAMSKSVLMSALYNCLVRCVFSNVVLDMLIRITATLSFGSDGGLILLLHNGDMTKDCGAPCIRGTGTSHTI